jgi:tetratricopeptide (TPR) repeat protein
LHTQALQASGESMDGALQAEALEATALLQERLGNHSEATVHLEARFKKAEVAAAMAGGGATGAEAQRAKLAAGRHLIRVHSVQGDAAVEAGKLDAARRHHERCLNVAQACGDRDAEAKAYAALGRVNQVIGDLRTALDYQQRFLALARQNRDGAGESTAALSVAQLQRALGEHDESVSSFRAALEAAEASQDLGAMCTASRQLGEAYRAAGDGVKAVHYLTEHFRVARDVADPATLDSARFALGFARGAYYMEHAGARQGFLSIVHQDMPALLEWLGTGHMP